MLYITLTAGKYLHSTNQLQTVSVLVDGQISLLTAITNLDLYQLPLLQNCSKKRICKCFLQKTWILSLWPQKLTMQKVVKGF